MKDVIHYGTSAESAVKQVETEQLKPTYTHCLFLHGGAPLERMVRNRIKTIQSADRVMKTLSIPHTPPTLTSPALFDDNRQFDRDIRAAGISPVRVEFIPQMMEPNFHIRSYAEATDAKMTELAQKQALEVVVGHSVGSLAALEAIALKIDKASQEGFMADTIPTDRPDIALPKLLVLIDPLMGGLTQVARAYLDALGQSNPKKAVPGLLELYPNSDYLIGLRNLLRAHQDFLPKTIVIDSQVGPGWIACPLGAVPSERFKPIADKLHLPYESATDDGMGVAGIDASLFPAGKFATIRILGLPHAQTLKHVSPILEEIMKKGSITDIPIDILLSFPPDAWPVIDKRAWLWSSANTLSGKTMEVLFKAMTLVPMKPVG